MQKGDLVNIVLHPELSEGEQADYVEECGTLWLLDERCAWYHNGDRDVKVSEYPPEDPETANYLWWCKALSNGQREQWYVSEMELANERE